jgi:hypothetical protein
MDIDMLTGITPKDTPRIAQLSPRDRTGQISNTNLRVLPSRPSMLGPPLLHVTFSDKLNV